METTETGTEIVEAEVVSGELAVAPITQTDVIPLPHVREALITGKLAYEVDDNQLAELIQRRLLESDDIAEIFDPTSRDQDKKKLGEGFTLRGVVFAPSQIEEAKNAVYAIMDVVTLDGVPHVWSTGAAGVVTQLLHWRELRESGHPSVPSRFMLIEVGTKKASKNRPIYLQMI